MTRQFVTLSTLLFTMAACAGTDGEALSHQLDDTRAHADALRTEIEEHVAAAAEADLAALRTAEQAHHTRASEHMGTLAHAIDDMQMCGGAPHEMLDGMMRMRDMCNDEMDRHRDAIAAAVDLATARVEEQAHRTAMTMYIDELDAMAEEMMGNHGMMMCRGHHGVDAHGD